MSPTCPWIHLGRRSEWISMVFHFDLATYTWAATVPLPHPWIVLMHFQTCWGLTRKLTPERQALHLVPQVILCFHKCSVTSPLSCLLALGLSFLNYLIRKLDYSSCSPSVSHSPWEVAKRGLSDLNSVLLKQFYNLLLHVEYLEYLEYLESLCENWATLVNISHNLVSRVVANYSILPY